MNIAEQQTKLRALREEAALNADALRARLTTQQYEENATELDQPTDNADAATPLFERERDDAMLQDFTGVIERIDRALARIDAGTYGICVRCGKPIEEARLEAFPNSEYNLECQEIVENE